MPAQADLFWGAERQELEELRKKQQKLKEELFEIEQTIKSKVLVGRSIELYPGMYIRRVDKSVTIFSASSLDTHPRLQRERTVFVTVPLDRLLQAVGQLAEEIHNDQPAGIHSPY